MKDSSFNRTKDLIIAGHIPQIILFEDKMVPVNSVITRRRGGRGLTDNLVFLTKRKILISLTRNRYMNVIGMIFIRLSR